jgi:uridine kinase
METIEITIANTGQKFDVPRGTNLFTVMALINYDSHFPYFGALVNNKLRELDFEVFKPKTIEFVNIGDSSGHRIYSRSLSFVLIKAIADLFPGQKINICLSVSKGLYWEFENQTTEFEISQEIIDKIKNRIQEIIAANIPIFRKEIPTNQAIELFDQLGYHDKVNFLKSRLKFYTSIYRLEDQIDYFYGPLVPSTGYLGSFDLVALQNGLMLVLPNGKNPPDPELVNFPIKVFEVFKDQKKWAKLLGISTIGELNLSVKSKKVGELIKVAEALHEKKVAQIADYIFQKHEQIKVILIAGPSSSGKTTFSKRLAIQLKVLGLFPELISMDNYFVNREDNPLDENGKYDFETLKALDVELFNNDIVKLLEGVEVNLPRFSFTEGKRFYNNHFLKLSSNSVLIIEGIHALNPDLTPLIENSKKYKIYVSALTTLSIDYHNLIPTSDNRLLRRIIRDHRFRGYNAYDTIKQWPSVRAGEEKHIFPFQNEANIMFKTATIFELGVIKKYAEPLLNEVPENLPEYSEANRLLKFLSYFIPIPDREIPPTAILREFFGGSSFYYD